MSWELFEKVKTIGLPSGSYAIFGSGPMVVRGIRSCKTIDVIVTNEVFNEYKSAPGWDMKDFKNTEYLSNDAIFLWKEWGPGEWDVKELIEEAEVIEGLPFVRLGDVLRWKKIFGREKDLQDIKLVEQYLAKKPLQTSL